MNFRYDIQALRGYAVLLILLFHAGIGGLGAGYLGVDIFFVISGFLITTLLVKHLDQGDFSFKEFYFRRARRLIPAAYVVLFLTCIGSFFFLTSNEYRDFQNQMLGSLTFTANMALYDQADYFGGDAKLKPLLHMWSLAIEEQFYFFLPLALFFTPRKYWVKGGFALLFLSLSACVYMGKESPDAAFYLLPFRAWELLIGSVGALYFNRPDFAKYYRVLFWPALAALLAIPAFPLSKSHPGIDAFIVCLSTLILILRQHQILNETRGIKILARIGDYSYSLYLVHWPLFAFANNAYLSTEVPLVMRASLLVVAVVLAVILYHIVEKPIHHAGKEKFRKIAIGLGVASVLLIVTSVVFSSGEMAKEYKKRLIRNTGLATTCAVKDNFIVLPECETTKEPKVLIWGDSYAMHLVPGLKAENKFSFYQATRSSCGPFLNFTHLELPKYNQPWGRKCIKFNDDVLAFIKTKPSIEIVVLSSPFWAHTDKNYKGILRLNKSEYKDVNTGVEAALEAMAFTVKQIRALGKKVVIVSPPPTTDFHIGVCLERLETGKITAGKYKDCSLSLSKVKSRAPHIYEFLERLPKEAGVNAIILSDYLCKEDVCPTMIDGKFLYRDRGHLSYEGSEAMARHIGLSKLIMEKAR